MPTLYEDLHAALADNPTVASTVRPEMAQEELEAAAKVLNTKANIESDAAEKKRLEDLHKQIQSTLLNPTARNNYHTAQNLPTPPKPTKDPNASQDPDAQQKGPYTWGSYIASGSLGETRHAASKVLAVVNGFLGRATARDEYGRPDPNAPWTYKGGRNLVDIPSMLIDGAKYLYNKATTPSATPPVPSVPPSGTPGAGISAATPGTGTPGVGAGITLDAAGATVAGPSAGIGIGGAGGSPSSPDPSTATGLALVRDDPHLSTSPLHAAAADALHFPHSIATSNSREEMDDAEHSFGPGLD